jgi:hypothetical protein
MPGRPPRPSGTRSPAAAPAGCRTPAPARPPSPPGRPGHAASRALGGRHHGDLVRVTAPGQRVPFVARLAAARTRRALPGLPGAPGPGRRPVRARRHRGAGRVHPHPPLQLLDLSQQRRDHRISLRQGSQRLLAAELPGIRHALKLRISRHSRHDHRNRRVSLKSDTGNRPEWIPTNCVPPSPDGLWSTSR